jgi:hypothetical protein
MMTTTVSSDDLDELDVKAEVMVIFLQKESLVSMMTMTDDLDEPDVKAEEVWVIFHQKKLHSNL